MFQYEKGRLLTAALALLAFTRAGAIAAGSDSVVWRPVVHNGSSCSYVDNSGRQHPLPGAGVKGDKVAIHSDPVILQRWYIDRLNKRIELPWGDDISNTPTNVSSPGLNSTTTPLSPNGRSRQSPTVPVVPKTLSQQSQATSVDKNEHRRREEAWQKEAAHKEARQKEAAHKEARHKEAAHKEARHKEAAQKEAAHREAGHREAGHREAGHKEAGHKANSFKESSRKETMHREAGR